jgi:hypothetical protein
MNKGHDRKLLVALSDSGLDVSFSSYIEASGIIKFLSLNISPMELTHVLRFSMAYKALSDKVAFGRSAMAFFFDFGTRC